jgi:dihydroorotate dehydrogenase electron transfer subunit
MSDPHRSTCYADRAWYGTVAIEENLPVAQQTYRLRFRAPQIAARIVPGQFIMVRLVESDDPLLARPLAVYDVVCGTTGGPDRLDVVYLALGKMTRRLATLGPGRPLMVWGPLGNGFPPTPTEHLVMVAGGIGQTPFLALAAEYLGLRRYGDPPRQVPRAANVTLLYGARSRGYLACVDDFQRLGVDVLVATDDGTAGQQGLVTDLIRPLVNRSPQASRIVCCGPEPMMERCAEVARELGIGCQVSLETPMACGMGICFSCVAKVRDAAGQWDYRRTCVEGPVFDAQDVDFRPSAPDWPPTGAPNPEP